MRVKELFTIPTESKVTEKQLSQVLAISICSILLCMACLVGTTWAWFVVSVENTGNVIEIGKPEIVLKIDEADFTSGEKLTEDLHLVHITHGNEADSFNEKSTLYVTLTIQKDDKIISGYTLLNRENGYETEVVIQGAKDYKFSWEVSWFVPANASELEDKVITIVSEETKELQESDTATKEDIKEEHPELETEESEKEVEVEPENESDGETNGELDLEMKPGDEDESETGAESEPETGTEGENEAETEGESQTEGETEVPKQQEVITVDDTETE